MESQNQKKMKRVAEIILLITGVIATLFPSAIILLSLTAGETVSFLADQGTHTTTDLILQYCVLCWLPAVLVSLHVLPAAKSTIGFFHICMGLYLVLAGVNFILGTDSLAGLILLAWGLHSWWYAWVKTRYRPKSKRGS